MSSAASEPVATSSASASPARGGVAAEAADYETIYSSSFAPDPRSARDVLAFMLTPVEAFATPANEEEFEAVTALLESAKTQALKRWYGLHVAAGVN